MLNFDESFFQKEIRSEFEVPELMKRAWAGQLEILQFVIDVCEETNIQYYAYAGTLLGAVRHRGYIPWDDDIDICMKRADYDQFVKILPSKLPAGFEIAGMFASDARLQGAGYGQQLRVIAEAGNWDYGKYLERFHGYPFQELGIDIFPLDYIPRDPALASVQSSLISAGIGVLSNWEQVVREQSLDFRLSQLEELWNVKIPRDETAYNYCWRIVDHICSLFSEEESDEVQNLIYHENMQKGWKKEWLSTSIKMPFENIMIEVPVGYHEALQKSFGSYMEYEKFTSTHRYPFYSGQDKYLRMKLKEKGYDGELEDFCASGADGIIVPNLYDIWNPGSVCG